MQNNEVLTGQSEAINILGEIRGRLTCIFEGDMSGLSIIKLESSVKLSSLQQQQPRCRKHAGRSTAGSE